MGGPDHYRTLGVGPGATSDEIRAAYIALARRLHPDFHADADAATRSSLQRKMQQVNASWEVLSDPQRRRHYDRSRGESREFSSRHRNNTGDGSPRRRSELDDEVRSEYESAARSDPVRARLVALTVFALGLAVVFLTAWLIVGWRGFAAGLVISLLVTFGAFFSIPVAAVFSSYRSDQRR